jgi:hypothetical protein
VTSMKYSLNASKKGARDQCFSEFEAGEFLLASRELREYQVKLDSNKCVFLLARVGCSMANSKARRIPQGLEKLFWDTPASAHFRSREAGTK